MIRRNSQHKIAVNRCLPQIARLAVCCSLVLVAACAANRGGGTENDFVEVANPGMTMYSGAPATIWVPKSSVDNGPPRASEAIKMAYKSVQGGQAGVASPQSSTPATSDAVVAQQASSDMRNRVAVIDTGNNQLAISLKEKLRVLPRSPVLSIAPEVATEGLQSRDERAAYAVKAWQGSGANVSLFVSAPDGLASGRYLSAEIYDGMGAGLISKVEAVIPAYDAKDSASLNAAVASAIALLAERARDAIALLPWYGKIAAVEGDKLYINVGRESGINIGQKLNVLRGGKAVQGLGFAPGTVVGTLVVSGFIGSNGATATVKDGAQVYGTDIIAVH